MQKLLERGSASKRFLFFMTGCARLTNVISPASPIPLVLNEISHAMRRVLLRTKKAAATGNPVTAAL